MIKRSATAWSVDDVLDMTAWGADEFSIFASFHDTWQPTEKTSPEPETNTPSDGGSSNFPSDSLSSGSSTVLAKQRPDYRLVDINANGSAHWRGRKMAQNVRCNICDLTRNYWLLIRRRIIRLLIWSLRNNRLVGVGRFSRWLIWQKKACVSIVQRRQWMAGSCVVAGNLGWLRGLHWLHSILYKRLLIKLYLFIDLKQRKSIWRVF